MRLSDIGRGEEPLPAEIDAELDALDAALRGEDLPPGMDGIEALVSDVRAERASPEAEFGDALDRWAAAGFPRGRRPGLSEKATKSDAGGRLRAFLASLTPRRLAYAGGAAATVVVVAVAIAQVDFGGDDELQAVGDRDVAAQEATPSEAGSDEAVPDVGAPPVIDEGSSGGLEKAGTALLNDARRESRPGPAGGQDVRKVERDAQMTLAAPADEVQDVTNEAISVVQSNRGIVESSQTSGNQDQARATLQLTIPTRMLDVTLDQLSDLADVQSLSEGSVDITRPFVDAKDQLAGLRAERMSLIDQIQAADTQEELDQLRARHAAVLELIAEANAEFENIQRRAAQSHLTLQITSEGADEGDWSLEDALDDAGRVLTVGAGIALISAAVLLPLALIAAIAYFVIGAARNRSRERALDE